MSARILQLSDLHLYADRAGLLAGVSTWATFEAVLARVRAQHADFDHLILTGDLAQDEQPATYALLRESLGDWLGRCHIIPGNHDDPGHLRAAFPELFPRGDGPLTFELDCAGWRIIGLDSHLPSEVRGRVGAAQLDWLAGRLGEHPQSPTLIFVHHPPVAIDVAWIDRLGLEDAAPLVALIERSAQVRIVCAGHVHQESSGRIGAAAMYTTPSTCVQFGARAQKSFDTRMAGYRSFTLDAGGYRTEVHRLQEGGD